MAGPYALKRSREDLLDWDTVLAEIDSGKVETHLRSAVRRFTDDCATVPSLVDGVKIKLYGSDYAISDDGAFTVRDWVRSTDFDSREFLFINLMEAHTSYNSFINSNFDESISVGVTDVFKGVDDPKAIKNGYRNSVRYLSEVYRDIFDSLSESFDCIITLSDHGELLGEHDLWNHVLSLHPEIVQIPIVIAGSNIQSGVCDRLVSILDIYETILSLARVPSDKDSRGVDLMSADIPEGRELLTEYYGLMSMAAERMREGGACDREVRQYESCLNGLVTTGYYGYETIEGFQQYGGAPVEYPEQRLASLVGDMSKRRVEDEAISKSTKRRLEDLGLRMMEVEPSPERIGRIQQLAVEAHQCP
jgi:hypothetical protein